MEGFRNIAARHFLESALEEIVGSEQGNDTITTAASVHIEQPHLAGNPNHLRSLLHNVSGTGKTAMVMSAANAAGVQ